MLRGFICFQKLVVFGFTFFKKQNASLTMVAILSY